MQEMPAGQAAWRVRCFGLPSEKAAIRYFVKEIVPQVRKTLEFGIHTWNMIRLEICSSEDWYSHVKHDAA